MTLEEVVMSGGVLDMVCRVSYGAILSDQCGQSLFL